MYIFYSAVINGSIIMSNLTYNGYIKFANGLIIQWGNLMANKDSNIYEFINLIENNIKSMYITSVLSASNIIPLCYLHELKKIYVYTYRMNTWTLLNNAEWHPTIFILTIGK